MAAKGRAGDRQADAADQGLRKRCHHDAKGDAANGLPGQSNGHLAPASTQPSSESYGCSSRILTVRKHHCGNAGGQ